MAGLEKELDEGTLIEIDGAWVLVPPGVKVMRERERYSHRNGETEPPTRPGWYWVKDVQPKGWDWIGLHMRYVDRISKNHPKRTAYRIDSVGNEYLEDIGETLQWWGPIVPPWEQDV